MEKSLGIQLLLVGDGVPSPELFDHQCDGLILVADVIFGEFFDVLDVDSADNGFNANCFDGSLECELLPLHFLFFLKLEELMASGGIRDSGIDMYWRNEVGIFKGNVARYKVYFGFREDEGQVAMAPFGR